MTNKGKSLIEIVAAAREELTKIPGVVSVGLGPKQAAGEITDTLALRVYVDKKIPLSDLKPSEVVPRQFMGMRTDVLVRLIGTPASKKGDGIRPILGGIQIKRFKVQTNPITCAVSPSTDPYEGSTGTLGYVAKQNGGDQLFILSCEHVLLFGHGNADDKQVFQPAYDRSSGIVYNKVGLVVDGVEETVTYPPGGQSYFVDCAKAEIIDTESRAGIAGVPAISGSRDLITEFLSSSPSGTISPIQVQKVGRTTGITKGVVTDMLVDNTTPGFTNQTNQILVQVTEGQPKEDLVTSVDPNVIPPNTIIATLQTNFSAYPHMSFFTAPNATNPSLVDIKYRTQLFGDHGDSGAVVTERHDTNPPNNSPRVIGLLHTMALRASDAFNLFTGDIFACHIGPVCQRMNLEIQPTTAPTSGATIQIHETAPFREGNRFVPVGEEVTRLEEELCETTYGAEVVEQVRFHMKEIAHLVHECRKVKVCWYRNEGPAIVAVLAKNLARKDMRFPERVKDADLQTTFQRMYRVLVSEGSASLQAALQKYYPTALELINNCHSLQEGIEALKLMCNQTRDDESGLV